jgi:hypothetical protein
MQSRDRLTAQDGVPRLYQNFHPHGGIDRVLGARSPGAHVDRSETDLERVDRRHEASPQRQYVGF